MKESHFFAAICSLLLAFSLPANGAGGVLRSLLQVQKASNTTESFVAAGQIPQSESVTGAQTVITGVQLLDIVGIYELVSCEIRYTNGSTIRCSDYTFSGDAAITPHNTAWYRAILAGELVVSSGVFTLSNNTMTFTDDLDHTTDVSQVLWDGQYLTLTYVEFDSTEIDVWRRTVAPSTPCPTISDSDGDGVINQWDNCAGTPAGSCVDKTGCPVDIPRCVNMTPTYNLLLDEDN